MKFETILNNQVDMEKVDLDSIKPWISNRITEILKHEDDVVIEYVYNQLEPQYPDPKEIQANLSGFFSMKNARIFLADLWKQLLDSMSLIGIKNGTRINQYNTEKTRNLLKLPTPETFKIISVKNNKSRSSEYREDSRRYKRHRTYSRSSRSRSKSYRSRYRDRRRSSSSSRYRSRNNDKYHRNRSRSSRSRTPYTRHTRHTLTRTSSGHTPYTRYSDYTDERERISEVSIVYSSSSDSSSSSSSSAQTSSGSQSPSSSSSSLQESQSLSPIFVKDDKGFRKSQVSRSLSPINVPIEKGSRKKQRSQSSSLINVQRSKNGRKRPKSHTSSSTNAQRTKNGKKKPMSQTSSLSNVQNAKSGKGKKKSTTNSSIKIKSQKRNRKSQISGTPILIEYDESLSSDVEILEYISPRISSDERKPSEELHVVCELTPKDCISVQSSKVSPEIRLNSDRCEYLKDRDKSQPRQLSKSESVMSDDNYQETLSSSSSSEYTIEYVEKTDLVSSGTSSEEGELSDSDIEWITNEEYENLRDYFERPRCSESCSSSGELVSSAGNSSSSSDVSISDVVWLDLGQLETQTDHYHRL